MFISQISAADWGQAETTYNLYEVLFKVHKVSYEKDAVMCIRAVQILITSLLSLKMSVFLFEHVVYWFRELSNQGMYTEKVHLFNLRI